MISVKVYPVIEAGKVMETIKINKVKAIDNYVMIKYYKDEAIAVAGKVERSKLTLKSWYVLRDKAPRRGLLIRKRPKTK